MLSRLRLLSSLFFVILTACNQTTPKDTNPTGNTPVISLTAIADSYVFTQAALSLVPTDKGVLANDTLPQTFELSLSKNPQHGTLELNQDGSFHYQHDGNKASEDSFEYMVTSTGQTASANVTLMLEVVPVIPPDSSPCTTSLQSGQPFSCQLGSAGATSYELENAPTGMMIQKRSGLLHWTPTTNQVGSYSFVVKNNKGEHQTLILTVTPSNADPAGLYVSPDGNDANAGSSNAPFKTLQRAVEEVKPGMTIYLRGGEYFNADYGRPFDANRSSNGVAKITVSGTAQEPITLRSYGNEFVKLSSDESGLIFSGVNHWIVDGLELEGSNSRLDYDLAMKDWWADDNSQTSGRGINNNSQHVTIRNCIIHDFPGAGVGSNGADFVTVQNNIIYNNGWWTTAGTHGVANSFLTTTDPSTANQEKLIMEGNLVFGNQSLIISHVFSKGKVTLTIDEGNGLHAQNNRKTFQGKARVENNLLLFNGKAGFGINTMDRVIVKNNVFYQNARVVENAGELILQSSSPETVSNNLFMPNANRRSIKDSSDTYINVVANATVASSLDDDLPNSVLRQSAVFQNPDALDFRPVTSLAGMGVPETELTRMFETVGAHGINVMVPTQEVNASYLQTMKQYIFDNWPASYSTLVLTDDETGFEYTYAQRCHYPDAPSSEPCP